jgi:hypothetical protein
VNKKKEKKVMSLHFAIEDIRKFNVIMKLKKELNETMTHWQITPLATDTSSHLILTVLTLEVQELGWCENLHSKCREWSWQDIAHQDMVGSLQNNPPKKRHF